MPLGEQSFVPGVETGEKEKSFKERMFNKVSGILKNIGIDLGTGEYQEKKEEINEELEQKIEMVKGEEYDDEEDHMFFETWIDREDSEAMFKAVVQDYGEYDPGYKIDFAKEDPDWRKAAERILVREAVIGEKIGKFSGEHPISADTIESSEIQAGKDMYILRSTPETEKESGEFGEEEGRQLGRTMMALQYKTDSSAMMNEIMAQRGYEDQYELENEFSEDIFNDFDGLIDNTRDNEGNWEAMEKYRGVIEARQMEEDEYSICHNETWLDNLRIDNEGRVLLHDWRMVGTTQNRELSLVNDLGKLYESVNEDMDSGQAEKFLEGLEDEIGRFYREEVEDMSDEAAEKTAEAVIALVKIKVE